MADSETPPPRSVLSKTRPKSSGGSKKSVRFADEDAATPADSGFASPALDAPTIKPVKSQSPAYSVAVVPQLRQETAQSAIKTLTPPSRISYTSQEQRKPSSPVDFIQNLSLASSEFQVMPSKCPIEQGILNDCWLLSTSLSLWRTPSITNQCAKKVARFCYLIRLWSIGCEWEAYRVHTSNLPKSGGVVVHSEVADYVRYVEGAFLGYFQGAESLAKAVGDPVEAYVWLTGGFAERLSFNQSEIADRRIFTILNDHHFYATVQQSGEKQRHSCAIVQWEKLPFGNGCRYLVIDSNLEEESNTLHRSHSDNITRQNKLSSSSSANFGHTTLASRNHTVSNPIPSISPIQSRPDSKTELINQIAKSHPNMTLASLQLPKEQRGALTGWYTPQRLTSTFDACTICRPLIHEDEEIVRSKLVQIMSSWIPDVNSGGSRRNLESFATNPQFIFKLHLTGQNTGGNDSAWLRIDGQLPWLWISLNQPFKFERSSYSHIAFHVYKLPNREPPTSPLKASFFLHSSEMFSSLPYANYSMTAKSCSDTSIPQTPQTIPRFPSAVHRPDVDITKASSPVVYLLVVPSTYFPVKQRTEFLLRVFSEIGELTFHSAWNLDPKTVSVPWSLFTPDSSEVVPETSK